MPFPDIGTTTILIAVAVLLGAGTVKGAFGAGLPLISVPPLAAITDPVTAIAIMTIPILGTNAVQAVHTGNLGASLKRFWPFIVTMLLATIPGSLLLAELKTDTTSIILGAIVLGSGLLNLRRVEFSINPRAERWLSPAVGTAAGLVNGFSSLAGPLLIVYLLNLRLAKDAFVATCALVFLLNPLPIYFSFAVAGVYTRFILLASALALLPALVGVAIGTRLRGRISDHRFRQALSILLLVSGASLIAKGI